MCCIFWLHCPSLLQDPSHHITTSCLLFQKITHYVQFLLSMYSWVQDFLMEHGQFIRGSCSFFKKKYFLLILWDFHIVCSNSTHFPEPPYLPLNLVVSPYKENLKRNKSKILIKNTKQIQQKTKQPNKKHTKKS